VNLGFKKAEMSIPGWTISWLLLNVQLNIVFFFSASEEAKIRICCRFLSL